MACRDQRTGYNTHAVADEVQGISDHAPDRGLSQLDGASDAMPKHTENNLPETPDLETGKNAPSPKADLSTPDVPKQNLWQQIKGFFKNAVKKVLKAVLPDEVANKVIEIGGEIAHGISKAFNKVKSGFAKVGHAIVNSKPWKAIKNSGVGRFLSKWAPRAFRMGKRLLTKVGGYALFGLGVAYDVYDATRTTVCAVKISKGEKNLPGICKSVEDDIKMVKETAEALAKTFGNKN